MPIPSTVAMRIDSRKIQTNRSQCVASSGSATPNSRCADRQQQEQLDQRGHEHRAGLADEVRDDRQRRAAEPLQRAVAALLRDRDPEVLHAGQHDACGDEARQVVGGDGDAAGAVRTSADGAGAAERRSEDQEDHGREEKREEDGVPLAEILPHLPPHPDEPEAQRPAGGERADRRHAAPSSPMRRR